MGACRHEGEGSLFALLKARGWATSLSAGEGSGSFSARSFFSIGITLTDEGGLLCFFCAAVLVLSRATALLCTSQGTFWCSRQPAGTVSAHGFGRTASGSVKRANTSEP